VDMHYRWEGIRNACISSLLTQLKSVAFWQKRKWHWCEMNVKIERSVCVWEKLNVERGDDVLLRHVVRGYWINTEKYYSLSSLIVSYLDSYSHFGRCVCFHDFHDGMLDHRPLFTRLAYNTQSI
jgi:hypothetical protein